MISLACLSATGFTFDLKCSKLVEGWWGFDRLACIVDNLRITNRDAVISPSSYDDIDEIESLEIKEQTVHYVPKFTVKIAKRLKTLEIYDCGLKEVRKEDLKQFPQLKLLKLRGNDLEWLKGDLFAFNPKLIGVSFEENKKLKYIGADLLDSLPIVQMANFNYAGCIDSFAITREDLELLKTELQIKCKYEPTKLEMPTDRTTTTTTTTESTAVTSLEPSQADENPTEASV
jgi:hypothetical protein